MTVALVALLLVGCSTTKTDMPQTNHQPLVLTLVMSWPGGPAPANADGTPGTWQDLYISLNGSESRSDSTTDAKLKAAAAASVNSAGDASIDATDEEEELVDEVVDEVIE